MKPVLVNNPLRNPFNNRFNDPVTWRLDEMQAQAEVIWLREHNLGIRQTQQGSKAAEIASHSGRVFAGFLALFVLLVSVVWLFNAN